MSTQARGGSVTSGDMGERQFSQLLGKTRDTGSDFLSFEYFQRDPLLARDRPQYSNDLTAFGGSNFEGLYGAGPGTLFAGNQTYALPKNLNGSALTASALVPGTSNLYDVYQGAYVTPGEKRWSVFSKENQNLTDNLNLYFEGLFTRRNVSDISAAAIRSSCRFRHQIRTTSIQRAEPKHHRVGRDIRLLRCAQSKIESIPGTSLSGCRCRCLKIGRRTSRRLHVRKAEPSCNTDC